jgi:transcriptional regulator with XRE-family HTH domain
MRPRRTKSLLERKAENPGYRKRQEEGYAAFKLEAQILAALEQKGWSYSQLADATQTSKSNICRDLKGGGLPAASLSRLYRIAEALGMRLVTLLIPKEQVQFVVPEIEALVRRQRPS